MPRPRPTARARGYQRGPHLYRRPGRPGWYARGGSLPRGGVSLKTDDRLEAERRFAALLSGGAPHPGRRASEGPAEAPIASVIDQWIAASHGYSARTLQSHANRLLAWAAWCEGRGVTLVSEVTPRLIDDWVGERSREVGRRTLNRDLRAVKVCLRWSAKAGLCGPCAAVADREPMREPHKSRRRVVPDPRTLADIVQALSDPRARAATEALAATGLRVEELRRCRATWLRSDGLVVTPEDGPAAEAWSTKGYAARHIPLAPEAVAAVERYLAIALGRRGKPITESALLARLREACATVTTARIAARVGALGRDLTPAELTQVTVPACGVHDLRRLFVTEAYRAGVPLLTIAQWVGHADVRTTEGYLASYATDAQAVAPVPLALREKPG